MPTLIRLLTVLMMGIVLVACTNVDKEENPETVQPDVDQEDTGKDSPVRLEDEEDKDATEKEEPIDKGEDADTEEQTPEDERDAEPYVFENDGFKIMTPAANTLVTDEVTVKGKTSAFEGNVLYTLEDGHFIFDEGHVTAHEGGVEWRDFEITFDTSDLETGLYHIVVYEESAKDGSIINEIMIPIEVDQD